MPVIGTPIPPVTTGMIVSTARDWVRNSIRDGNDSSGFSNTIIDRAIQQAGNRFCRETRYLKRADSVIITAGSTIFPTTAPIAAGFLPERILGVWIDGQEEPIDLIGYGEINRLSAGDSSTRRPTRLAFLDSASDGRLWPMPSTTTTATLRYWLPFTAWTPGSGDSTTINLPDEVLQEVLTLGAATALLKPSPEKRFAAVTDSAFEKYIARMKGTGHLGSRVIDRKPSRYDRSPRRVIYTD